MPVIAQRVLAEQCDMRGSGLEADRGVVTRRSFSVDIMSHVQMGVS